MGQYYLAVLMGPRGDVLAWILPSQFHQFGKLREQYTKASAIVHAVMLCLTHAGGYHKCRVVWAGDYADTEEEAATEDGMHENLYHMCSAEDDSAYAKRCLSAYFLKRLVASHEVAANASVFVSDVYASKLALPAVPVPVSVSVSVSASADDKVTVAVPVADEDGCNCILVNHTKNLFVDTRKHAEIHPLPLLTCEGNGRGGGDYSGPHMEYVGSWARDILSVEDAQWLTKREGFAEFEHVFEGY